MSAVCEIVLAKMASLIMESDEIQRYLLETVFNTFD